VLKRLLDVGYNLEELTLDPSFNALHGLEGWKKLTGK
jgi:hypothetical protein